MNATRSVLDAPTVLGIDDLWAGYGSNLVLRGLSLSVAAGEILLLIGQNGAGKSTTARAAMGLIPTERGSVMLQGIDVTRLRAPAKVQRGLSYIPQATGIFPSKTVEENLELGAYSVRDDQLTRQRRHTVYELFPALAERRSRVAGTLSGGEQRMLAVGIGLMLEPAAMFVDEPSIGLAPVLVNEVLGRVRRVADELGTAIVLIEQNVKAGLSIADRVSVLKLGAISGTFDAAEFSQRGSYWDLF